MEKHESNLKVRISCQDSLPSTEGEIQIQRWNPRERSLRAIRLGGLCWLAAIISVLIPILHFILVPGFLIAGPIVAYFAFRQEQMIRGGEGVCPKCLKNFPIVRSAVKFPLSDLCSHCHSSLSIETLI